MGFLSSSSKQKDVRHQGTAHGRNSSSGVAYNNTDNHHSVLTENAVGDTTQNGPSLRRSEPADQFIESAKADRRFHRFKKAVLGSSPSNLGDQQFIETREATTSRGRNGAYLSTNHATPGNNRLRDEGRKNQSLPFGRSRNELWSWIPHIAQSADDATVTDRVKDVFVSVEQFVNNFYVDRPYQGNISDETMERANCAPLLSTPQLQKCLSEVDHQIPLIKHVLIALLLDLTSFNSTASKGSLLPKEFQNYNLLAKARTKSTAGDNEMPYIQPALSSYRVLSAFIRSDAEDDDNYLQERQLVVEEMTGIIEKAFRHWTKRDRTREDRQGTLHKLLDKAGSLGIFLFSQPSVFHFDWTMELQDQSKRLIPVWPRLLRVFDNNAQQRAMADHMIPMNYGVVFDEVYPQEPLESVITNGDVSQITTPTKGNAMQRITNSANDSRTQQAVGASMQTMQYANPDHNYHSTPAQPLGGVNSAHRCESIDLTRPPDKIISAAYSPEGPESNNTQERRRQYTDPGVPNSLKPGFKDSNRSPQLTTKTHQNNIPRRPIPAPQSPPSYIQATSPVTQGDDQHYQSSTESQSGLDDLSTAQESDRKLWLAAEPQRDNVTTNRTPNAKFIAELEGEGPVPPQLRSSPQPYELAVSANMVVRDQKPDPTLHPDSGRYLSQPNQRRQQAQGPPYSVRSTAKSSQSSQSAWTNDTFLPNKHGPPRSQSDPWLESLTVPDQAATSRHARPLPSRPFSASSPKDPSHHRSRNDRKFYPPVAWPNNGNGFNTINDDPRASGDTQFDVPRRSSSRGSREDGRGGREIQRPEPAKHGRKRSSSLSSVKKLVRYLDGEYD